MNPILQKLKTFYKTEILFSHSRTFQLYVGLFIYAVVLFLVMGIFPQLQSISSKVKSYQEIKQKQSFLVTKNSILDEYKRFFDENSNNVTAVYNLLPNSEKVEEFLVEVVTAGGSEGFMTKIINVAGTNGNTINISIKGVGPKSGLATYLKNLEQLKRIAKVTAVQISKETQLANESYEFVVTMEIYINKVP